MTCSKYFMENNKRGEMNWQKVYKKTEEQKGSKNFQVLTTIVRKSKMKKNKGVLRRGVDELNGKQ